MAFHDNDLRRTCGRPGKISELPWSEVSKALVDGKAPIPLLEDLLGCMAGCADQHRLQVRLPRSIALVAVVAPHELVVEGVRRGVQRFPA